MTPRTMTLSRYLLLLLLALASTTLPLALRVGANLEYEYALLASYAALVLFPLAAAAVPLQLLPRDQGLYAPSYAAEVFWILVIAPAVALAPGLLLFATKRCLCSGPGFAFWMAVQWYPAWLLAHALMQLVYSLRCDGLSRGWTIGAGICGYLALTVVAAYKLWTQPQKHWISPLLGFWHGPVYDTYINVDHGLILARAGHLGLAVSVLLLTWTWVSWRRWRRLRLSLALSLVVSLTLWLGLAAEAGTYPSMQNSKRSLDQLLTGVLEGPGYTLRYQPASMLVPEDIQLLDKEARFHLSELSQLLSSQGGDDLPHVTIYAYPSRDEKKLWFGAGATDVTDVHLPSVHVTAETWPHPTLRHELVHALASGFGYRGLGFHPNMAFTEGLAVALAPSLGALTLDQESAALTSSHRLPPLDTLFSPAFWTVAGDRAYTVAGSLLRYLIKVKGMAGVKALYSGKSWTEAFGASEEQLTKDWQDAITKDYDAAANALYTDALFSDPGLFHDRCPHSKADLAQNRSRNAYTRMRQLIGWDPEADYLPYLLKLSPGDEEVQVQLERRRLKELAADYTPRPEDIQALRQELAVKRQVPAKQLADIAAGITEADILKLQGDSGGSLILLDQLAEEGKGRFLGAQLTRDIAARQWIERDQGHLSSSEAAEWRRYLAGWRRGLPSLGIQLHTEPWLLSYLKLRSDKETVLSPGELHRLLVEAVPEAGLPPSFHQEWYRLLAERLMRFGAYADAEQSYAKAAGASPPASREVYEQYSRRAAFYAGLEQASAAGKKQKQ